MSSPRSSLPELRLLRVLTGLLGRIPHWEVTNPTPDEPACNTKPAALPARIHPFARRGLALIQISDVHFWDTIFSMDTTSTEGLSNITTLIHSPSDITVARSLRGNQAQGLIDLIDRVSVPGDLPLLRVLITRCSFSRYPILMRKHLGVARNCSTRSAKPVGYYPHHLSFNQSSPMLVSLGGVVALQM